MKVDPKALAPVYLLHSPEPLLIDRAVAAIRDASVPESARGFNFDVLEAKAAGPAGILRVLQTVPMMAERRLVIVRDLGALNAAALSELVPYLESPNPTTVWVALVGKKLDKRIKFFQRAKKLGFLHELAAPKQLGGWLKAEARELGVSIAPAAQRRLAEVVGSDLARLSLSLSQLALYAGDREVSAEDVDDLIAETRERTVFELTDAIGAGDRERADRALASLFDQRQSAIGVVVMLARHMRQIGWVHEGQRLRLGKGELAKRVGAPPFVVDKLAQQARTYTPRAVARALSRLSEVDRALKGQGHAGRALGRDLNERLLIEGVVTEIISDAR